MGGPRNFVRAWTKLTQQTDNTHSPYTRDIMQCCLQNLVPFNTTITETFA